MKVTLSRILLLLATTCCMVSTEAQEANPLLSFDNIEEHYELYMKRGKPKANHEKEYILSRSETPFRCYIETTYDNNDIVMTEWWGPEYSESSLLTNGSILHNDTRIRTFRKIANDYHRKKKRMVKYARHFEDLTYLTTVFLREDYYVKHKTVTIEIPAEMSWVKIHEYNFDKHIKSEMQEKRGKRTYTITIDNLAASRNESGTPSVFTFEPHIVVDGVFSGYEDMYKWNMDIATVDCTIEGVKKLIGEITKDCKSDEEKIAATYSYVQEKIRYIAFEAGIEGFRPDRPQEVLRKGYGDCKGMAMLLKTLLKEQGFDAHFGIVGTHDRPYKFTEVASICASNHAICVLEHKGKRYFLDATYQNIGYDVVPGHIQGKEVIVDNGGTCYIAEVPCNSSETSVDSLACTMSIDMTGGAKTLRGDVVRAVSGDRKEMLMASLSGTETNDKEEAATIVLDALRNYSEWSDIKMFKKDASAHWATMSAKVTNTDNITVDGKKIYVDTYLGMTRAMTKVDTLNRKCPYALPMPCRIVREMRLKIPAGYKVASRPADTKIKTTQGVMTSTCKEERGEIAIRREFVLENEMLRREDMDTWNADVNRFQDASREMVVLEQTAESQVSKDVKKDVNKSKTKNKKKK